MALPDVTILTTSSFKHHDHLITLGATRCFDRSAQDNTAEVRAAAPGAAGVDAIVDCVAAAADQPSVFSALNPDGPKIYSQVITGVDVKVPDGINSSIAYGKDALADEDKYTVMAGLTRLLLSGKYKVPIGIKVVGNGYSEIERGLDLLMKGVSGLKYVVTI